MSEVMLAVVVAIMCGVSYWLCRPAVEPLTCADGAADISRRGWHDEGRQDDAEWPIAYSGRTDGIDWTASISPAADSGLSEKAADRIWWSTDAVRKDEFLLVAGFTRWRPVDWRSHAGVQRYADLQRAADTAFEEIGRAAEVAIQTADPHFLERLQELENKTVREHLWLTIDRFLEKATDLTFDMKNGDVQVKTLDPAWARGLFDRVVISKAASCAELVTTDDAILQVWLGAPNLRLHLAAVVADEGGRIEATQRAIDLGVAIARNYRPPRSLST